MDEAQTVLYVRTVEYIGSSCNIEETRLVQEDPLRFLRSTECRMRILLSVMAATSGSSIVVLIVLYLNGAKEERAEAGGEEREQEEHTAARSLMLSTLLLDR